MTTHRRYSCNLCHDTVGDGTGVGIIYAGNPRIRLTVPSNAETHICQKCITAFEAALADQRAHQKLRDDLASDAVVIELARTARD